MLKCVAVCCSVLCVYILLGAPARQKFIGTPTQMCVIAAIMIIAKLIRIYVCEHILIGTPTQQEFIGEPTQMCVIAAIMIIAL